jgi:ankyrin repeat protein
VTTELHHAVENSRDEVVGHVQDSVETSTYRITSHVDRRLEQSYDVTRHCMDERLGVTTDEIKAHIDRQIHGLRDELLAYSKIRTISAKKHHSKTVTEIPSVPQGKDIEGVVTAMKLMLKTLDEKASDTGGYVDRDDDYAVKPPWAAPKPAGANNRQCDISCECVCHSFASFTGWRMTSLQSLIGAVTVGYSGYTPGGHACDTPTCKNRLTKGIRVLYSFPRWLMSAAISCQVSSSAFGSPELLLRVIQTINRREVAYKQHLLSYSTRGDIPAVKNLLETRATSLHDVENSRGICAVMCATMQRRPAVVELLLKAGADPFQEDWSGRSAARVAFEHYLGGSANGRAIAALFPLTTFAETAGFSDLHRIVVGTLHIDITHALKQPRWRAEVNRGDSYGSTPLNLAAMKGDLRAVGALLDAGADPNHSHPRTGQAPLHEACRAGHTETVARLLAGGANVHARTTRGDTALHLAAQSERNSIPVLELLLAHDADIDARNQRGCDALPNISMRDDAEAATFMIDHGARVSSYLDNEGDARINDAINDGGHRVARVYLERGATYSTVNNMGCTVMHHLAVLADAQMIDIFTEVKMRGLDLEHRDVAGRTPVVAFEARWQRAGCSKDLRRAWDALLRSIQETDAKFFDDHDPDEDDASDDEFHEALETADM